MGSNPVWCSPRTTITAPAIRLRTSMCCRTNCPIVLATAPNARNTRLNPMMNRTEFNRTDRISLPSCCFNCSTPAPDISEMYPGTKGNTHGERNDSSPAVNAAIGSDCIGASFKRLNWILLRSLLDPRRSIDLDEVLGPLPSSQPQPERTALRFHAKLNVEKRAAQPLSSDPLSDHRNRLGIGWKFKFVAVGKLSHGLPHGPQGRPKFVKVPLTGFRVKRQSVAGEWAFVV